MKNDFIRNNNIKNQPKKAVKKTFSFYALVFALLFMFIGSILGSIAFVRTSNIDTSTNIAYADTVGEQYYYEGSNFFKACSYWTLTDRTTISMPRHVSTAYLSDGFGQTFNFISIAFGLTSIPGTVNGFSVPRVPALFSLIDKTIFATTSSDTALPINLHIINNNVLSDFTYSISSGSNFSASYPYHLAFNGTLDNPTLITSANDINQDTYLENGYIFANPLDLYNNLAYCRFSSLTTYGFNCNIVSVEFGNLGSYSFESREYNGTTYSGTDVSNYIKYTDSNGRFFYILFDDVFLKGSSVFSALKDGGGMLWQNRFYYLSSSLNSDTQTLLREQENRLTNDFNNRIFELNQQHVQELQNVRQSAYNEGRNDGLETADNATFLGLFGALFDAPIQALSGLLNFDVLGFNLWNFFTAVITIGIVIFVVRIFL